MNLWPKIIDAVDTPIGILALALLLVGTITLIFFGREQDWRVKMVVFVMVFGGLSLLSWAIVGPAGNRDAPAPDVKAEAASPPPVADKCAGVDISLQNAAVRNASWCGSPGAGRTTAQQKVFDPTPSCIAYAQRVFAGLTQNELRTQAKILAKQDQDDKAFELIDACQCHRTDSQASVRQGRQNVICYLKRS